ncbi:MAG: hypothetical protein ABIR94_15370 [Rubrivivax sp.]
MKACTWIVAALVGLAASADVPALTLAPYSASSQALLNLVGSRTLNDFGTLPFADSRYGAIVVSTTGTPGPLLQAQADIGPNLTPSIFGRGTAILFYTFAVLGPQGPVAVTVDVSGSAVGSVTPGASIAVTSSWSIFLDQANPLASDDIRSGQVFTDFSDSFARNVALTLAANVQYTVKMLVDAQAAATGAGSRAFASAFVDPVFALGAGVNPDLYALQFSAGIGNVAAVPEPASVATLSIGLLLLSTRLRRRRGTRRA